MSAWHVYAAMQPILGLACEGCGAREWIGFLDAEWLEYVAPLSTGKHFGGQAA